MEPPVAVRRHPLLFELPFERKRGHDAGNHFLSSPSLNNLVWQYWPTYYNCRDLALISLDLLRDNYMYKTTLARL